jgi:Domain of unknown function (DUF2383)
MATGEKHVRSVFDDLTGTCKDGEQGFRTAAEKAKDTSLKSLFAKYASQREEYARELQCLVTQMGGDPGSSGHVGGTLHRGWLRLKEALNYREARGKELPANVAAIVERQAAGVEEAHRAISDLKHGRTAMAASRI